MRKIHVIRLSHSQAEGTFLTIEDMSLTSLVFQDYLGDSLFGLLSFMTCEWMYGVRWGPVDPEWGIADRSLGSKLFSLSQWAGSGFGAFRRVQDVAHIPVSEEWVREYFPDAGWPWGGTGLDEMQGRASDAGDVAL